MKAKTKQRKDNPWQGKLGKNRTWWKVQERNEKRERTGEDRTQQQRPRKNGKDQKNRNNEVRTGKDRKVIQKRKML